MTCDACVRTVRAALGSDEGGADGEIDVDVDLEVRSCEVMRRGAFCDHLSSRPVSRVLVGRRPPGRFCRLLVRPDRHLSTFSTLQPTVQTLALTHVVSLTRHVHKRSFERASSLDVGNKKNAEAGTVSVADHRGGACDDAQLVAALDRVGFEAKVVSKVAGEPPALAAGDDEERGAALDGSSAAEERVGLRTTDTPPPSSPPRGGEDAAAAGSWWK